jgi:hypothetical protein
MLLKDLIYTTILPHLPYWWSLTFSQATAIQPADSWKLINLLSRRNKSLKNILEPQIAITPGPVRAVDKAPNQSEIQQAKDTLYHVPLTPDTPPLSDLRDWAPRYPYAK